MVTSGSSNKDEREPIVSFTKHNNRISWFSDTDLETDPDEDVLVNGGPVHRYSAVTRRKRPYSVRYKEYCTNKRTKKRALLLILVIVFLIIIIGLVYLYYSKTSLQEGPDQKRTRPLVKIDCGEVLGVVNGKESERIYSFKGLPYAQPPVGKKRWKAPVPLREGDGCWTPPYDATRHRAQCAQLDIFTNQPLGNENCLYLNVLTPTLDDKAHLPVLFWIHGGYLMNYNGSVSGSYPDATFTLNNQVVSVTFNYRLNIFGFLALDVLSSSSPSNTSGNYGVLDQIQALKWVKRNIKQFGGDPNWITIAGQSSGGTSVFALLASPLSKGLFVNAISISGSTVFTKSLSQAAKENIEFIKNAKCSGSFGFSYNCLYNLTTREALLAMPLKVWNMTGLDDIPVKGEVHSALMVIEPVVLPFPPTETYLHSTACKRRISLLVGTTAQETGLWPPKCFSNKSVTVFSRYVLGRLGTFSSKVALEVSSLYENATKDNLQFVYETMSSDIRVTCPNNHIAYSFSKSSCHNVFRYVITNSPSHIIEPGTCKYSYAHHSWDMNALFGFRMTENLFIPQNRDYEFSKLLQHQLLHFVKYGHPGNSRWSIYPLAVGDFSDNGLNVRNGVYHRKQCSSLGDNGFLAYGWVN